MLRGKELFDQGKLNLDGQLDLSAVAGLNDDGTLNLDTLKFEGTPSDENIVAFAHQLITALSQSKVFGALRGAKEVRFALKLDNQNLSVKIASELPSEEQAAMYVTAYDAMLIIARRQKQGTDDGEIYDSIKFDNDGKLFLLSFEMPRGVAQRVFADLLAKMARRGY